MDEEWRPIAGWEDYYEVSNYGAVRRKAGSPCRYKTSKVLRQKVLKPRGYRQVCLKNERRGVQMVYVHRLVCTAFHGHPTEEQDQCCHADGDTSNNRADNLRWGSRSENERDKVAHGRANRGERHGLAILTDERVRQIYARATEGILTNRAIADQFGVSVATVSDIKRGARWGHITQA